MALHPKERKRLKRLKVKETKRRHEERIGEVQRLDDYYWLAVDCDQAGDHAGALKWAVKILEARPSHGDAWNIALHSARALGDMDKCLSLLAWRWRAGLIGNWKERFSIGRFALEQKDYRLASEIFESVLKDPMLNSGWRKKKYFNDVQLQLRYAQAMLQASESSTQHISVVKAGRNSSLSGGTAAGTRSGIAPMPIDHRLSSVPNAAIAPALFQPAAPEAVETLPDVKIEYATNADLVIEAIRKSRQADRRSFELALQAYKHSFRVSFDQLLCLPTLRDVEPLWHQQETARKVLKAFRGRAILADEVGLGKTIEAGMVLKEYLLRGLVKTVLVLTPSSLVDQWKEELHDKFGLEFASSNDPLFREDLDQFWSQPLIVASIAAARTTRHFEAVTSRTYDMVIVDEAHHLKNQRTRSWQLVNAIHKTFFLLLTATPVQNRVDELYNLVTILKPGHLKTRTGFLEQFVARGKPTDPRNRERLKELLKEIMIRNTRSVTQLQLPPRFAFTTRVESTELEQQFYQGVSSLVAYIAKSSSAGISKMGLRKLLEAAGSSHQAALGTLEKLRSSHDPEIELRVNQLHAIGTKIGMGSKTRKVLQLLKSLPDRKIVFVNYLRTLHHLREQFGQHGIPHTTVYGSLTPTQKASAMEEFRNGVPVLLASGTGGEGYNLQFCNVMINYDLPWNPMEIEQRIGRVHRIGQEREVQVYNFCAAGSVEDHILEVLDKKINMFELVVGEVDMILGHLQDEREFSDMVFEIWTKNSAKDDVQKAFDEFSQRLQKARLAYKKTKEFDEKLFGEDFGV
ncbi:MAG: DEAD/DEAH box helicase [Desulfomonile sp.]|nr:DEAD/DEAH box helicase [Desulfomonile sp.]